MGSMLERYASIAGTDVIHHLMHLGNLLQGMKIVHVNSTREGGGVAEILHTLVPLMQELGLETSWEVIEGNESFFTATKSMHNGLQGKPVELTAEQQQAFEKVVADNAERLRNKLSSADVVFIHDPQPAPLIQMFPSRSAKWIWRCHIDSSRPHRPIWRYLHRFVNTYDASIFSLPGFAQRLDHPQYLIPPSIDPLADKNIELPRDEIEQVAQTFGIDPEQPLIVQISRFDRFKDPVGVIESYRLVKRFIPPLQVVLAGGSATDDPEGKAVLDEVREIACGDEQIHVLELPPDAHRTINALQRMAHIVLQKSLREGFGLTVTEAMWKHKPVIGGDVGGIRLQVVDYHTGFRVSTPEGAALRIRYLFQQHEMRVAMGEKAHDYVRDHFLITRHLREYLTLILSLTHNQTDRIELT